MWRDSEQKALTHCLFVTFRSSAALHQDFPQKKKNNTAPREWEPGRVSYSLTAIIWCHLDQEGMHGGSGSQSQHITTVSIWFTNCRYMFRFTGEKTLKKTHGCQRDDACCLCEKVFCLKTSKKNNNLSTGNLRMSHLKCDCFPKLMREKAAVE